MGSARTSFVRRSSPLRPVEPRAASLRSGNGMRTWSRRLALALGLGVALLAILIAWQWRSDLPLATLQARWATGASQFIDVDAISVHYRDEGTGPAIVLL